MQSALLLTAVDEETYCLRTQTHVPYDNGRNVVCYRCGMLLGPADRPKMGTLLDY
jgi:hypothetical protein